MVPRGMPMNRIDGALFGECDGFVWRVFHAPWWRVDRWIHFWVFETRPRGVLRVPRSDGDQIDAYRVVRCVDCVPPNVVREGTAKPKRGTIYR